MNTRCTCEQDFLALWTLWRQLTDWHEQVTTWRDLCGLLYNHSDIMCLEIELNCTELQLSTHILIWVAWLFDQPVPHYAYDTFYYSVVYYILQNNICWKQRRFYPAELQLSNSFRVRRLVLGLIFKQAQTRSIFAVCGNIGWYFFHFQTFFLEERMHISDTFIRWEFLRKCLLATIENNTCVF
jgi:hypothetical protein